MSARCVSPGGAGPLEAVRPNCTDWVPFGGFSPRPLPCSPAWHFWPLGTNTPVCGAHLRRPRSELADRYDARSPVWECVARGRASEVVVRLAGVAAKVPHWYLGTEETHEVVTQGRMRQGRKRSEAVSGFSASAAHREAAGRRSLQSAHLPSIVAPTRREHSRCPQIP